jgi:hypothetical protein
MKSENIISNEFFKNNAKVNILIVLPIKEKG